MVVSVVMKDYEGISPCDSPETTTLRQGIFDLTWPDVHIIKTPNHLLQIKHRAIASTQQLYLLEVRVMGYSSSCISKSCCVIILGIIKDKETDVGNIKITHHIQNTTSGILDYPDVKVFITS